MAWSRRCPALPPERRSCIVGGPVLLLWRARLRRSWRRALLVAVTLAVGGAVALAAGSGARRTEQAFKVVLDASNAGEIGSTYVPLDPDEHYRLVDDFPAVGAFAQRVGFQVVLPDEPPVPGLSSFAYYNDPIDVERPVLLEGRLPATANEVVVSEDAATVASIAVGDSIQVAVAAPDFSSVGPPEPMAVVGIGLTEVYRDEATTLPVLIFAKPFVARHRESIAWGATVVRLAPGATRAEAVAQLQDVGLGIDQDVDIRRRLAADAIRPTVVTIWALACLAFGCDGCGCWAGNPSRRAPQWRRAPKSGGDRLRPPDTSRGGPWCSRHDHGGRPRGSGGLGGRNFAVVSARQCPQRASRPRFRHRRTRAGAREPRAAGSHRGPRVHFHDQRPSAGATDSRARARGPGRMACGRDRCAIRHRAPNSGRVGAGGRNRPCGSARGCHVHRIARSAGGPAAPGRIRLGARRPRCLRGDRPGGSRGNASIGRRDRAGHRSRMGRRHRRRSAGAGEYLECSQGHAVADRDRRSGSAVRRRGADRCTHP